MHDEMITYQKSFLLIGINLLAIGLKKDFNQQNNKSWSSILATKHIWKHALFLINISYHPCDDLFLVVLIFSIAYHNNRDGEEVCY